MEMDWSKFCAFHGLFDGHFLKKSNHLVNVDKFSGIIAHIPKVYRPVDTFL